MDAPDDRPIQPTVTVPLAPERAFAVCTDEPHPWWPTDEVEVRFSCAGESSTRVDIEHRALVRHGECGDAFRDALASPRGWPYVLDRYTAPAG